MTTEYINAADPEGYYEEEFNAKQNGCSCTWKFIYNENQPPNCNWGHGKNIRIETNPLCPLHVVI